jgi:hypothetical protein
MDRLPQNENKTPLENTEDPFSLGLNQVFGVVERAARQKQKHARKQDPSAFQECNHAVIATQ